MKEAKIEIELTEESIDSDKDY